MAVLFNVIKSKQTNFFLRMKKEKEEEKT